jgi:hypothetical protein
VVQVAVQVGSVFGLTATNFDVGGEAELYRLEGELSLKAEHMANGMESRLKQNDEPKTKKRGRASSPLPLHPSSEKLNHPEPDLNRQRELRR